MAKGVAVESRMEVRRVLAQDLGSLHDLDREVFGTLAYPYFALRQIFDVHADEILVAQINGRMCGYSLTMTARSSDASWFQGLGVVTPMRGRGIGRRLARAALVLLHQRGSTQVRLAVRSDDVVAKALYESLGFQPEAEEADYYGVGENRTLMFCTLTSALVDPWSTGGLPASTRLVRHSSEPERASGSSLRG
ncbi:GNAT family N-acetyltransferase [Frankia sp. R82]|uniref:GNAT family N-acetyltransferase n=1 Tax=Frankia sp. R82 TaxID=2950553 RepID=UPI002043F12E|nr:GNAT family N-acetyltransferase [Frankia sp. R82]MCM3882076.1 GNAT family N-acetyltransferase [Frankia sp. R82]